MTEIQEEIIAWVEGYFDSINEKPRLISVLLALQKKFGYLPTTGLRDIAHRMNLTPANIYGVATFYNQFRFQPPGRYPIKVCMGTACHIKQGTKVLEHWERCLEIEEGQVTADGEYSLDRVACVGCCTLAPVTLVGDEVIGGMAPTKVDGILLGHKLERQARESEKQKDE